MLSRQQHRGSDVTSQALNRHRSASAVLTARIWPEVRCQKLAILGAFLLAAAQYLTGDGSMRSRASVWLLLGVGVVVAALYVILS
jgi:hypothetical protein